MVDFKILLKTAQKVINPKAMSSIENAPFGAWKGNIE